jgi:hypothetical protein
MSHSAVSRRDIFRLLAAASAAGAMLPKEVAAQAPRPLTRNVKTALIDPDFLNKVVPWEKPLTEPELITLTALVDLILPADDESPAASEIELPDFLNEWVGAPYQENIDDCEILRGGIAWLNAHCVRLHGARFEALAPELQTGVLDSICDPATAAPALAIGTRFFKKLRMLALGGYYSHSSTWKSLGYVGNVPVPGDYPGVPDEIIALLGLEDVA